MATVSIATESGEYQPDRSYKEDTLEGIYDKRQVQFKNITGKVYLSAKASHYFEDFTGSADGQEGGIFGFGSGSKDKAKNIVKGVYESKVDGNVHGLERVVED